ncbi:MAG: N,N-dimethylformamidase beta subunit family domain-containing protein [Candidatus Nitrosocosmicus sp.]
MCPHEWYKVNGFFVSQTNKNILFISLFLSLLMGLCAISFSVDQYGHAQTQGQLNTSGPSSMNVNQTNATSANIIKLVDGQLPHKPVERVALVEPTFTYAAYQNGSFYNFYTKYSNLLWDDDRSIVLITTDLDLLKDRPIPHGPFPFYTHPEYNDIPYINYFNVLLQHLQKDFTFISKITDVDVHEGNIFQNNGKNAYDVLFLFHSEYVTQSEYNNLKKFVSNGGTIVFTEANVLYAEVSYNKSSDSISLVNGHDWKIDGNSAKHGTSERWLDENKEWMGSNFLDIPSWEKVYFRNNPFNYNHTEEQYVTNPDAKILLDYEAYNLTDNYQNATVATYMMNYGKGKVVHLGIWGHTLTHNEKFLNYFDKVIIPIAYDLDISNNLMKTEPSPEFTINVIPTTVELRPGEKKTIQIYIQSETILNSKASIELSRSISNDNLITKLAQDKVDILPLNTAISSLIVEAPAGIAPQSYTLPLSINITFPTTLDLTMEKKLLSDTTSSQLISKTNNITVTVLPSPDLIEQIQNLVSWIFQ